MRRILHFIAWLVNNQLTNLKALLYPNAMHDLKKLMQTEKRVKSYI